MYKIVHLDFMFQRTCDPIKDTTGILDFRTMVDYKMYYLIAY